MGRVKTSESVRSRLKFQLSHFVSLPLRPIYPAPQNDMWKRAANLGAPWALAETTEVERLVPYKLQIHVSILFFSSPPIPLGILQLAQHSLLTCSSGILVKIIGSINWGSQLAIPELKMIRWKLYFPHNIAQNILVEHKLNWELPHESKAIFFPMYFCLSVHFCEVTLQEQPPNLSSFQW